MKFKKQVITAALAAAVAAPAFAAKLGDVNLDGYVLMESWVDTHNDRPGQQLPSNETNVFLLHNINLWGDRDLSGGQKFVWKLGHRNRNGNLGGTGAVGSREAWLGFEGDYGSIKFGRFLTKAWEVLDWPYGSPSWQSEAFSETGAADWVTVRALRYATPKIGNLQLEFTYDVGSTSTSGRAALMEGFARYTAGPIVFDAIAQRKNNTAPQIGVGNFGDGDGLPNVNSGNNQGIYFLGSRYQMGGGVELIVAYKRNYWHSDSGLASLTQGWAGQAATPGTDVHNDRILLGVNYNMGKWDLNGAIQKVRNGHDNVAGDLDDGATIIGGRVLREVAPATWLYAGIRNTRFNGSHTPVDSWPWQVQGSGAASKSNTRIGIGAQMLF